MRSSDEKRCGCESEPFTEVFGTHHKNSCEDRDKLSPESAAFLAEILSSADVPLESKTK